MEYEPIKWTKKDIEEMEAAGIVFHPTELDSDIIYVDKDGNEIEPPKDDEQNN